LRKTESTWENPDPKRRISRKPRLSSPSIATLIESKQDILNYNVLTIPKILNLQFSLNDFQDYINLKENIITYGSLTIPKIFNLQSSLNDLRDNINSKQNSLNDNN
jgi:hypothetical protein